MAYEFAFLEDDEELELFAPAFQPKIYVVMRISPRLGGTYSEIRKSYQGVRRLLREWDAIGINMQNVRVYPMQKEWIPIRKTKNPTAKKSTKEQIENE